MTQRMSLVGGRTRARRAAQHARKAKLTTDSGAYAYLAMSSSNAAGGLLSQCRWRMALPASFPWRRGGVGRKNAAARAEREGGAKRHRGDPELNRYICPFSSFSISRVFIYASISRSSPALDPSSLLVNDVPVRRKGCYDEIN